MPDMVISSVPAHVGKPEKVSWEEFLRRRIDWQWRPAEFDPTSMLLLPSHESSDNTLTACIRLACGVQLARGRLCPSCRTEFRESGFSGSHDDWAAVAGPRRRIEYARHCDVNACPRSRAAFGLCTTHAGAYRLWRKRSGGDVAAWVADRGPRPLPPQVPCPTGCGADARENSLCAKHTTLYRYWRSARSSSQRSDPEEWLRVWFEPYLDEGLTTYASRTATAFGLMPGTSGLELLYAVQQREQTGRLLNPVFLRHVYVTTRRNDVFTFVGLRALGREDAHAGRVALYSRWQAYLDDAYREWSGVDDRDPRVVFARDFQLRGKKARQTGAKFDLTSVEQPWIVGAFRSWLGVTERGFEDAYKVAKVWRLAAEVLALRGTPFYALGPDDMDALVRRLNAECRDSKSEQRRWIKAVDDLLTYARNNADFADTWGRMPAQFAVNRDRHRPTAKSNGGKGHGGDEPFRYVPAPIVEHLMDNLLLAQRNGHYSGSHDAYLTAEMRMMIFMMERFGRRTSETAALKDDCITYDNEGAAYLEWTSGKPPYAPGKRIPMWDEEHATIRDWQAIKKDHGAESEWLFPKRDANSTVDLHWDAGYLNRRLKDFIKAVHAHAPYSAAVEGVEGNLIHFNMRKITPYSFRHAFAQRYADATDEDGRPSVEPKVLMELMGHKREETAAHYVRVSAQRRKKAIRSVPARLLNLHGDIVTVSSERQPFGKVAVSTGHCTEPQNVKAHGLGCVIDYSCESCPFYLVDPLEREALDAKRHRIKVQRERALVIDAAPHIINHLEGRISDLNLLIDAVDTFIDGLPSEERASLLRANEQIAEIRRNATTPRRIDLRLVLEEGGRG